MANKNDDKAKRIQLKNTLCVWERACAYRRMCIQVYVYTGVCALCVFALCEHKAAYSQVVWKSAW